ncbi:hypothetical protein BGZ65_003534 [Modicella reniformis]|uniref:Uncharacterized protein n=1 Tax=Modicella reniformis TaxID=1440133 RepID=A0A9P6STQ6_9FUNG|nr:hypothetical protein BGZ65_003534 [Modicella reniformis]
MTTSSDEHFTQAFLSRSTDEAIKIIARRDLKSGDHIVLWSDILSVFKNADYIMRGEFLVPFLTDENFDQVFPLRIAYHSEDVLDVVIADNEQVHSTREATELTKGSVPSRESKHHDNRSFVKLPTTGIAPTPTPATSAVADINTDNQSIDIYSAAMPEDYQSILLTYTQQNSSSLQALVSGQASIQQSMTGLQAEIDKNKEFREQLVQMKKEMDEKQDLILHMQQQALERLTIIQSQVQALLTQTYELHEYPIPRLFIVLPKEPGFRNKLIPAISESYRLYFLCECGSHTMAENSNTPPEIHLAIHEGYDLDKPAEFFKNYGSYVLSLMYMVKYGITAVGHAVPPLASLRILDGLDTAGEQLKFLEKNIALHDFHNTECVALAKFDNMALEGADLRRLESYLQVKDQKQVLGNLYRIVTAEGHVKWVCLDHYRINYRESTIQQLREVVELNHGRFVEEIGRIEIKIGSNILVKQFYDAVIRAHGIQELDITLEWDATTDDVQALADAVSKANVIHLMVNGTYFKGATFYFFVNRGRRLDPILHLASKRRVRSLHLYGFDDFFSRVGKDALASAEQFRVFTMNLELPSEEKATQSYTEFLECCPPLTGLQLKLNRQYSIAKVIQDVFRKLHRLESLEIDYKKSFANVVIMKGNIHAITLIMEWLSDLKPDDLRSLLESRFTRLNLEYTPLEGDEDRIDDALRHIPVLSRLQIRFQDGRRLTIINTLGMTLQDLEKMASSDTLRGVESFLIDCGKHSLNANVSQGKIKDMVMTIKRLRDLTPDGLEYLQQSQITHLTIEYTPQEGDENLLTGILRHSPNLTHLQIGCKEERFLAITNLIISTRATIVQERISSYMKTIEVMEEKLTPFDIFGACDNDRTYMQSVLTFNEDSSSFDMRTWIRLRNDMHITDDNAVNDFIRQYGWSIVFFDEYRTKNDTFAAILDDIPTQRDTQLESLIFHTGKFTADGINCLDNIIMRSPNFRELGLYMYILYESDFEKAKSLVKRYGSMLFVLRIASVSLEKWLPRIVSSFPTRNFFPKLVTLDLQSKGRYNLRVPWIVAMVSAPPQVTSSPSPPQSRAQRRSQSTGSWTALRKIVLRNVKLQPEEWETVIGSIDFSELQYLVLSLSNISVEHFRLLVDRIPSNNTSKVPLKTLDIRALQRS